MDAAIKASVSKTLPYATTAGLRKMALQVGNRNTRQPNRFHPPICIYQVIQLRLHATGLRRVEPPPVKPPLDISFHKKCQLQRQPQPLILKPFQPLRQQFAILRFQCRVSRRLADCRAGNDSGAPACAEVVLCRVKDCDEDADNVFGVVAVRMGGFGGGVVRRGG